MIYVICRFLTVPWAGLVCVIVAFPGLVTGTEIQGSVFTPVTGTATQTLMVATGSLDSSADHW